ncbi:MAG: hypothetical protein AVDCRST_MAG27-3588, partial [uncultured Craurococcus sp.]
DEAQRQRRPQRPARRGRVPPGQSRPARDRREGCARPDPRQHPAPGGGRGSRPRRRRPRSLGRGHHAERRL